MIQDCKFTQEPSLSFIHRAQNSSSFIGLSSFTPLIINVEVTKCLGYY
ncbi:hypothetical protein Hanom_Chr15g01349691 [Helianthus anomalus]